MPIDNRRSTKSYTRSPLANEEASNSSPELAASSDTQIIKSSLPLVSTLISQITVTPNLSKSDKVAILDDLYRQIVEAQQQVTDDQFPALQWKDRPSAERRIDPCDFVIKYYPTYGSTLTQSDIRSHDFALYRALHSKKHNEGWPSTFDLPTQADMNSKLLEAADHIPSLKEIAEVAPPAVQQMLRLYEISRGRMRK